MSTVNDDLSFSDDKYSTFGFSFLAWEEEEEMNKQYAY